ncbi:MAG: triose-phosphate isomerase [Candidatus Peribacteraceae bacterium]
MSKSFFLGANWKMHGAPDGAFTPASAYRGAPQVDVVVFASFLDLLPCQQAGLRCGAQCARPEQSGTFTGDVSMAMLEATGIGFVLCGHSDRRLYHGETDAMVAAQARAAVALNITPVVCIGETLEQRESGKTEEVLRRQMETIQPPPSAILAYEPIWAISGGDPHKPAASTADAEHAHRFIRSLLPPETQTATRILYGGSMKGSNALDLLMQPNIDGGLVGGASLKPKEFAAIVEAAKKISEI